MNGLFFAYLANYWIIPLSLIPVYWILANRYISNIDSKASITKNRFYFGIGAFVSALVAITDGYYAFFYLLLIGFSMLNQVINGSKISSKNSRVALTFILITIATSLLVTIPLKNHRMKFKHEANQDQMKSRADAEVYVPTLKLLLTPIHDHRIPAVNRISATMLETANFNRKYPYGEGAPAVLGIIGSILLVAALVRLLLTRERVSRADSSLATSYYESTILSSSKLAAFILLCSISGGLGTLIALIFPSIRAYERFPIFLILVLYIGAGAYTSLLLEKMKRQKKVLIVLTFVALGVVAILDQTRSDHLGLDNSDKRNDRSQRFLAERNMIEKIQREHIHTNMIYQYPYSQYLTNNKYYGWGQFGHIRQYLHSSKIRWSNGAAKDSYIDVWHEKKSTLPMELLIAEMQAVGFKGLLVDRLVMSNTDYLQTKDNISSILNKNPLEDNTAKMAFWELPRSKLTLRYDEKYQDVVAVTINEPIDFNKDVLPRLINRNELKQQLSSLMPTFPQIINASEHPEIFYKADYIEMGLGYEMLDKKNVKGGVACKTFSDSKSIDLNSKILLHLTNDTDFDWNLDFGPRPLRVGIIVQDEKDKVLFDSRLELNKYLKSKNALDANFTIISALGTNHDKLPSVIKITLRLMQDGNMWFDGEGINQCSLLVNTQ